MKTHVLVFPYPAQGHMIPLLDLTRHLATQPGSPLTLTVLVTPANLKFLTPLLSLPNVQPLTLPFPAYPSLPAGVENNKDLPATGANLEHLRNELGHDRVWAVGPVNPDGLLERGGPASARNEVLTWLDAREEKGEKVVYVCFGSQAVLTNAQMRALALALESSGAHFVWSVKIPTEGHVGKGYGDVPEGFQKRVAGRGLVVTGWAPQVEILGHKAVGSFLTHCGWNSVLEGLAAGVTMLAWPMGADQFCNATLLVDELKVGLRVCEGADTVPNSALLARAIAESVSGEDDRVKRVRAIREAAEAATAKDGKSYKQLEDFVKRLGSLGSVG